MNGYSTKCLGLLILMVAAMILPGQRAKATLPPEVYYAANVAHAGEVDDAAYGPFDIGFSFDYFGTTYTQFYVTSNGWIGFNAPSSPGWSEFSNVAIPDVADPNNYIAAFWDDIIIHASGGVEYYQTIGNAPNRKCVVQMTNMGFFGDPTLLGTLVFILYETSNEIQVQYRIIVDNSSDRAHGSDATIGLENADGSAGVQYSYSTISVTSEQAIRFTPSGGTYTVDDEALYEGILLGDGNAPTIPQLTSPAHQAIAPQQPVFQWQPCDYTNSYEFRISTNSNLSGATVTDVGTATTYTPASPLTDEQDYYWAVFAVGDDGTTWSEILKFTASDSAPPTANPQTVWTTLGADAMITLDGTGGLSELTASISSLPLNGALYQYEDGGRGDEITAAPTEVTDAERRVIFYINDATIGTNRGNFEFIVADTSGWESDPGAVTVNVYPAPAVVTTAAASTGATTATSGGNVTDDGGSAVSVRGVCWGTSAFPTVANSHTTDGTGTGTFVSALTGLTTGATYYVRAYAQNEDGIAYGSQHSFPAGLPVLTTTSPTEITQTGATTGGIIAADGGAAVSERGVCWSSTANPTVADDTTNNGSGTGTFSSTVTGLEQGTAYHLRAYATNANGTNYGEDLAFTTSDSPLTYTVSGNAGVPYTELHYHLDGDEVYTLADSLGDYVLTVTSGWSSIVKPYLAGFLFFPEERFYPGVTTDAANQDYSAAPARPLISGNCGAPGAILRYADLGNKSVLADTAGEYSLSVPYGWSGSVTPEHVDYLFTPTERQYDDVVGHLADQDFEAAHLTLILCGYVRGPSGSGIAGVTLTGLLGEPVTDASGYYNARLYEGWSGTVVPTKPEHTFSPSSIQYGPMLFSLEEQDFEGFSFSLAADEDAQSVLPRQFSLLQNHPNPFNPTTTISVELPRSAATTLKIYNLMGQEVVTLIDEILPAGTQVRFWDGRDAAGTEMPTGIYLYRMTADDFVATKKMLLLK
ncbi:MAG: T9SS type A sorting domain-containing protein [bacterium]